MLYPPVPETGGTHVPYQIAFNFLPLRLVAFEGARTKTPRLGCRSPKRIQGLTPGRGITIGRLVRGKRLHGHVARTQLGLLGGKQLVNWPDLVE